MRKELHKLLEHLEAPIRESEDQVTSKRLKWQVFYIIVRRYEAIREELDLPDIGLDITGLIEAEPETDPYHQLLKPFRSYLEDNNSALLENEESKSFFNEDCDLRPSDIVRINKVFEQCGIDSLELNNFSIKEFDDFFSTALEIIFHSNYRFSKQLLDRHFASFISQFIPENSTTYLKNDISFEIVCQAKDNIGSIYAINIGKTTFWYFFRTILRGKTNLNIIENESYYLNKIKSHFLFQIPTIKKLPVQTRELFKDFNFSYSQSEALEIDISLTKVNKNGRAIFILPLSFLYKQNADYKKIRKKLTERGTIKSVVKLPAGMLGSFTIHDCLLEIDKGQNFEKTRFIDATQIAKYLSDKDVKRQEFFSELIGYMQRAKGTYPYVQDVDIKEIAINSYSWAFSNYFNVSYNEKKHLRSSNEKLVSLPKLLKRIKPETKRNIGNAPFLSITNMAENVIDFEIYINELPKRKVIKRAKELNQSAILLGKIVGSVKPSYFKYQGQSLYIRPNILAFEIPKEHDMQYLIHELRSGFVKKQFKNVESSSRISSYSNNVLKNIYLRVPPLDKQKELTREKLTGIAKNKIREVQQKNEDIAFIEKDVFSEFAHDFGKYLQRVRSNITTLKGYIQRLDEEGTINTNDSVFGDAKPEPGDRVKEVMRRLELNLEKSQEYLASEVENLSSLSNPTLKEISLKNFLLNWKKSQTLKKCNIEILPYPDNDAQWILEGYVINANKEYLTDILNNLLDNAVKHGFDEYQKSNKFIIRIEQNSLDEGNLLSTSLHIGNNGKPFPNDFLCEDFFQRNSKGPRSHGEGKGGYIIKRKLDNIGATVTCDSAILPREKYPVQFQINFKSKEV